MNVLGINDRLFLFQVCLSLFEVIHVVRPVCGCSQAMLWPGLDPSLVHVGYFSSSDSGSVPILLVSLQRCPKWISQDYCPVSSVSLSLSPLLAFLATSSLYSPPFLRLPACLPLLPPVSSTSTSFFPRSSNPEAFTAELLVSVSNCFIFVMWQLIGSPWSSCSWSSTNLPSSSDNLIILTWPDYCNLNNNIKYMMFVTEMSVFLSLSCSFTAFEYLSIDFSDTFEWNLSCMYACIWVIFTLVTANLTHLELYQTKFKCYYIRIKYHPELWYEDFLILLKQVTVLLLLMSELEARDI